MLNTSENLNMALEQKALASWNLEFIKSVAQNPNEGNNRKELFTMLQTLYTKQTASEQAVGDTRENNGVGFTSADSAFLSGVAENSKRYNNLTERQAIFVGKKMAKYAKQLMKIATGKI